MKNGILICSYLEKKKIDCKIISLSLKDTIFDYKNIIKLTITNN